MSNETQNEMISRLELMASGDPKWDLSDNDRAAIAWLLKRGKAQAPAPAAPLGAVDDKIRIMKLAGDDLAKRLEAALQENFTLRAALSTLPAPPAPQGRLARFRDLAEDLLRKAIGIAKEPSPKWYKNSDEKVAAILALEGQWEAEFDRIKKSTPAPQGPKATLAHDAGAIAQCGRCNRYTLNHKALSRDGILCECGETNYWSGSFKPPALGAKWFGPSPQEPAPQGLSDNALAAQQWKSGEPIMDVDDLRDLIGEYADADREYHSSSEGTGPEKKALRDRQEAMHCAIDGFTAWVAYARRLAAKKEGEQ